MNETTLLVSQFAGPIFAVIGLGILLNTKYFFKIYNDFEKSPFVVIIAGMATMVLGLGIVLNHNLWTTPQEVIVSLLGWLSLVKGTSFLLAPTFLAKIAKGFINKNYLIVGSLFILALGGYLSWIGFFA